MDEDDKYTVNFFVCNRDVNPFGAIHAARLSLDDLSQLIDPCQYHVWIPILQAKMRFHPEEYMEFYQPLKRYPCSVVTPELFEEDLKTVAKFIPPLASLEDLPLKDGILHLIIKVSRAVEMKIDEITPLNVIEARREVLIEYVKENTPSMAARGGAYRSYQRGDSALHDGLHPQNRDPTIAPPLELYHPVFRHFLNRVEDSTPDPGYLNMVQEFMQAMGVLFESESQLEHEVRYHLSRLLNTNVLKYVFNKNHAPDGLAGFPVMEKVLPVLVLECKLLGSDSCDPSVQAEFSLINVLREAPLDITERCCVPCFLIANTGPLISILGAVWAEHFIAQRLTDPIWAAQGSTFEDARFYKVAKIFMALRDSMSVLKGYYEEICHLPIAVDASIKTQRAFPYPHSFKAFGSDTVTSFEYESPLQPYSANMTFLARTPDCSKLVIKFVGRYGCRAHALLAQHNLAPALHYFGSLDGLHDMRNTPLEYSVPGVCLGPLYMVVMAYAPGRILSSVPKAQITDSMIEQVQKAASLLHEHNLVHGDLRSPNVVLTDHSGMNEKSCNVQLIDFDWAGEVGKAYYPLGISNYIEWPPGVAGGSLITKAHDLEMLKKLV